VRVEVYFLELFFRNLLMGENNELMNRYLLVNPPEEWKQAASAGQVTDNHPTSTRQVPDKLRPNNQNIIQLIQIIGENELSVKDMISAVGLKDRENFLQHYLNPAIQEGHLIPTEVTREQAAMKYADEADVLNIAMFGMTAKQWRDANPDKKGNIRDYATINELICLSNMENINAVLINDGMPQGERLVKLNQIAIQQMQVLENNSGRKLLK